MMIRALVIKSKGSFKIGLKRKLVSSTFDSNFTNLNLFRCPGTTTRIYIDSFRQFTVVVDGGLSATGEDIYNRYIKTQEMIQKKIVEQEKVKSEKMYQAWKRAEEKQKQKTSQGVAVVRTLVKETKKKDSIEDEIEKLQNEATEMLRKASLELKYPAALVQLGNQHLQKNEYELALDCYQKAGELGSSEGYYNLGHCHWTGLGNTIPENKEKAMIYFNRAVELGDADAMYFVGVNILGSVEADEEVVINEKRIELQTGLRYINDAANIGHGGALHYLALFYLNGFTPLNIPPCDHIEFVKRLDTAVENDSTGDAIFLRGSCYWEGDSGYNRDPCNALKDFIKASDLGHADAAVSAGAILHRGIPGIIIQNQEQAFALYQHAGELGSIDGWKNVIACYLTGEGVPQSESIAKYIAETMLKQ